MNSAAVLRVSTLEARTRLRASHRGSISIIVDGESEAEAINRHFGAHPEDLDKKMILYMRLSSRMNRLEAKRGGTRERRTFVFGECAPGRAKMRELLARGIA